MAEKTTTPQSAKRYQVTSTDGTYHVITCDFVFERDGCLIFKEGDRGESETIASFAPGQWANFVKRANVVRKGGGSRLMSLETYAALRGGHQHIHRFRKAYAQHRDEDPTDPCFKTLRTETDWDNELGLFIDCGGDATDPLEE